MTRETVRRQAARGTGTAGTPPALGGREEPVARCRDQATLFPTTYSLLSIPLPLLALLQQWEVGTNLKSQPSKN